jgi:hypothetical protein
MTFATACVDALMDPNLLGNETEKKKEEEEYFSQRRGGEARRGQPRVRVGEEGW